MEQEDPINILLERERALASSLPTFFKITISLAILVFILPWLSQVYQFLIATENLQSATENLQNQLFLFMSQVTIPKMIAFFLETFSLIIIWMFVIWSIFFIPFITYQAHKASRMVPSKTSKASRWLQLYAAAFLPLTAFALAWLSIKAESPVTFSLRITSLLEVRNLLIGIALVVGIIWVINRIIPARFAALRLSFLSTLLYISVLLTYGFQISVASHSMVFGILLYLMLMAKDFSDLGRRLAFFDVEDNLIDKIFELENLSNNRYILEAKHDADQEKGKLMLEMSKSEFSQVNLVQLDQINRKKIELGEKINQAQLGFIDDKLNLLEQVFVMFSSQVQNRMKDDIPKQIQELQARAKEMPREQLSQGLKAIIQSIVVHLDGLPESLDEVRSQLMQTIEDLERQTRLMANPQVENCDATPENSTPVKDG